MSRAGPSFYCASGLGEPGNPAGDSAAGGSSPGNGDTDRKKRRRRRGLASRFITPKKERGREQKSSRWKRRKKGELKNGIQARLFASVARLVALSCHLMMICWCSRAPKSGHPFHSSDIVRLDSSLPPPFFSFSHAQADYVQVKGEEEEFTFFSSFPFLSE